MPVKPGRITFLLKKDTGKKDCYGIHLYKIYSMNVVATLYQIF